MAALDKQTIHGSPFPLQIQSVVNTRLTVARIHARSFRDACEAFDCQPFLAIVVDAADRIRCFILPFETFYELYPEAKNHNVNWSMRESMRTKYDGIPAVKRFELTATTGQWWR